MFLGKVFHHLLNGRDGGGVQGDLNQQNGVFVSCNDYTKASVLCQVPEGCPGVP
jgi:hypothetical protein